MTSYHAAINNKHAATIISRTAMSIYLTAATISRTAMNICLTAVSIYHSAAITSHAAMSIYLTAMNNDHASATISLSAMNNDHASMTISHTAWWIIPGVWQESCNNMLQLGKCFTINALRYLLKHPGLFTRKKCNIMIKPQEAL